MSKQLENKKIAFLATDGFEQVELTKPWYALEDAGAELTLVSLEEGNIKGFNHFNPADTFEVDITVDKANASDYDGIVLPGGVHNPDALRLNKDAMKFIKDFAQQNKMIAAICHGPWTLIEAELVKGETLTSWPSLKTDIENAGGSWVDKEVMVSGNIITSRKPDDLEAFNHTIIQMLSDSEKLTKAA